MASVNDFTSQQMYTLALEIYSEATGNKNLDTIDSGDFVSVGQAILKTGYDPITGAICKVLGRTLFRNRAYSAKFKGLEISEQKFGAVTRKLYPIDDPAFEEDERGWDGSLVDDQSVDMYKIHKPKVVSLYWYGEGVLQKKVTLFRDQFDTAFRSAEDLAAFISMILTEVSNEIELTMESAARTAIGNLVTGIALSDAAGYSVGSGNRHIKLITAYNSFFGLTSQDPGYIGTVADAIKNEEFWKWSYAYIGKKLEMMENKTELFHTALTGKPMSFHTPKDKMNIYILSDFRRYMDTMAKASLYHDSYLKLDGVEEVSFWQSAQTPDSIKNKPTYLKSDGTLVAESNATTISNLAMVVFDRDAVGLTRVNQWTGSTPLNVAGGYTNQYYHWTLRYYNSFLENAFIVTLD